MRDLSCAFGRISNANAYIKAGKPFGWFASCYSAFPWGKGDRRRKPLVDEGSFRKTRASQLRNKRKDRVKILRIFWIITPSSVVLAYARPTASPPRGEAFWLVINVCPFPYEGKGDRNACVSVDEVESKTAEKRITRRDLELRVSHILVSVVAFICETLREFSPKILGVMKQVTRRDLELPVSPVVSSIHTCVNETEEFAAQIRSPKSVTFRANKKGCKSAAPHKEVLREWCRSQWSAPFSYAVFSASSEIKASSSSSLGIVKSPTPVK